MWLKFLLIGNVAVDWPLCSPSYWSGLSVCRGDTLDPGINEPLVSVDPLGRIDGFRDESLALSKLRFGARALLEPPS